MAESTALLVQMIPVEDLVETLDLARQYRQRRFADQLLAIAEQTEVDPT